MNQRGLGGGRTTPRGSTHRTSFIEYVSEVYNRRNQENSGGSGTNSGNHLDALSVHGHSLSSGSVASGISSHSLARDFSVRSENVSVMGSSQRLLSFRHGSKSGRHGAGGGLQRDTTKSARLAAGKLYIPHVIQTQNVLDDVS